MLLLLARPICLPNSAQNANAYLSAYGNVTLACFVDCRIQRPEKDVILDLPVMKLFGRRAARLIRKSLQGLQEIFSLANSDACAPDDTDQVPDASRLSPPRIDKCTPTPHRSRSQEDSTDARWICPAFRRPLIPRLCAPQGAASRFSRPSMWPFPIVISC